MRDYALDILDAGSRRACLMYFEGESLGIKAIFFGNRIGGVERTDD